MENNNITEDESTIKESNTLQPQEPPKKKSHTKLIIFGCLGSVIFIIIVFISLALWGFSMFFDNKPLENVLKQPDEQQLVSIAKKFGVNENVDSEENIQMQLLNTLMSNEKTITLNKDELNTLIDYSVMGGREYLKQKFPAATIANAYFKDGKLFIDASYKNSFSTPFGQYINMHITFIPGISNRHISLKITNLKLGSILVSGTNLQKEIDNAITDFEKTEDGKMIIDVVTKLNIQKESVTLTFNPQKLTMMLIQQVQGSDGSVDLNSLMKMLQ